MPKYKQRAGGQFCATGVFSNSTQKGSTCSIPSRPFHRGFAPRFHARICSDYFFDQYQSGRSWQALQENYFSPRPCIRMRRKPRSIPLTDPIPRVPLRSRQLPRHVQPEFTPRFHARNFSVHSFNHDQSDRSWKGLQESNFGSRPCIRTRWKLKSIPMAGPITRVKADPVVSFRYRKLPRQSDQLSVPTTSTVNAIILVIF